MLHSQQLYHLRLCNRFIELKVTQLPTITVQAEQIKNSYLAPKSSSTKRTEAILDTAKTVQVITEKALKDQGLLSLQQALATTPGISFGAGEGGGGYGDKINLRGYDANLQHNSRWIT